MNSPVKETERVFKRSVFALLCNANLRFIFESIISRDIELVILGSSFHKLMSSNAFLHINKAKT